MLSEPIIRKVKSTSPNHETYTPDTLAVRELTTPETKDVLYNATANACKKYESETK
jgi:hypothetical protein